MAGAIFSDSWFRVASVHAALLPSVKIKKQFFRGQLWFVLQDVYSQKFFRVTPQAYRFVSALRGDKTVEAVWEQFLEDHPKDAPGQEEVVQLLSQLHMANLLYFRDQPDVASITRRVDKQKSRERVGKLMSFLYLRIPLWNPNPLLNTLPRLIQVSTGPVAGIIWLLTVLWGGAVAIQHADRIAGSSEGLFALGNLPWLYVCMAVMKLLHEAGHAFFCKRYGGDVPSSGVMLLITTPLPYVDTTATWAFSGRWQRAMVSAAGMLVEFFLAALGALVWAKTGPGLVNSLAFNVMVIGSVNSFLFNGNPLLRFDAYYILSDLVEIPNLFQKAQDQWLHFGRKYLLGVKDSTSPATDAREWWWLTAYGILSFLYRWFVTIGVAIFLLDMWFWLGVVMLFITTGMMVISPLWKFGQYLLGPRLRHHRQRAYLVVAGSLLVFILFGSFVPLPHSIKAHGVLRDRDAITFYAPSDGALVKTAFRNGDKVAQGAVLINIQNPELDQTLESSLAELREAETLVRMALAAQSSEQSPAEERVFAIRRRLDEVRSLIARMEIRASTDGVWVAPQLNEIEGTWINRGMVLGEILKGNGFKFIAVIRQEQADELFGESLSRAELRLRGQADVPIAVERVTLIPYERRKLSTSALGWLGGGDIEVDPEDKAGERTQEAFYEVHMSLPVANQGGSMWHGLTGQVRIPLRSRPLFWQMDRAFRQMLQKRYRL